MAPQRLSGYVTPQLLAGMDPTTPVLLALSGGADSRALLHLLAADARRNGFLLLAAHVDHGIRGAEAERDRRFCERLCRDMGIELVVRSANVPEQARTWGMGLEEAARRVRYDFFAELMRERQIPILVTAHHADDLLETLLFRLCRGSGTHGLAGITPHRPFGSGMLVRPLLQVTRRDILEYCTQQQLEFVTDSTNGDCTYSRNRLRAEVVPILANMFACPQLHAVDAAAALQEDDDYLSSLASALAETAETESGLLCKPLESAPVPLCKRVLARYTERMTGFVPTRVQLEMALGLLRGTGLNDAVALAGDFVLIRERGLLRLFRRDRTPWTPYRLAFAPGEQHLARERIRITVQNQEASTKVHNLYTQSRIILNFDSAIISNGLYWRPRNAGDTLLVGGMHKRLRKLYGGVDLPPARRAVLPLLCDEQGVVWAPFVGVRDGIATGDRGVAVCVELLSDVAGSKTGKDV